MTIVLTTGWNLNTSSVVHLTFISIIHTWPISWAFSLSVQHHGFWPQHRKAVCCLLLQVANEGSFPFQKTPSSSIQHVKELSLFLNLPVYFRTHPTNPNSDIFYNQFIHTEKGQTHRSAPTGSSFAIHLFGAFTEQVTCWHSTVVTSSGGQQGSRGLQPLSTQNQK